MMLGYARIPAEEPALFVHAHPAPHDLDAPSAATPVPQSLMYMLVVLESPATQRVTTSLVSRTLIREHVARAGGRRLVHRVVKGTRNEVLVAFPSPPRPGFAADLHAALCRRYTQMDVAPAAHGEFMARANAVARDLIDLLCVAVATGYYSGQPYLDAFIMPLDAALASPDREFASRAKVMQAHHVLRPAEMA